MSTKAKSTGLAASSMADRRRSAKADEYRSLRYFYNIDWHRHSDIGVKIMLYFSVQFSKCNFRHDCRGVYAAIFAMLLGVLVYTASLVTSNWEIANERSNMQEVLDQALSAAAAYIYTNVASMDEVEAQDITAAKEAAQRVVIANRIAVSNFQISYNSNDKPNFTGTIRGSYTPRFNLRGVQGIAVETKGRVILGTRVSVEITLVLDVSKTMGDLILGTQTKKIDAVKANVKKFLNEVFFEPDIDGNNNDGSMGIAQNSTYFSLVPYSSSVRLPTPLARQWIGSSTNGAVSDANFAWKNGQTQPTRNNKETIMQRGGYANCPGYRLGPSRLKDTSPQAKLLPVFPGTEDPRTFFQLYPTYTPFPCIPHTILPLTDKLPVIREALDDLAAHNFMVMTHHGVSWGWRALSPDWDWTAGGGKRPYSYKSPLNLKYAIILVNQSLIQGYPFINNGVKTIEGVLSLNPPIFANTSKAKIDLLLSNQIATGDPLDYIAEIETINGSKTSDSIITPEHIKIIYEKPQAHKMLSKICRRMKNKDIEIFVIVYALEHEKTRDELHYCASPGSKKRKKDRSFTPTASGLAEVFQSIAGTINKARAEKEISFYLDQ